MLIFFYLFKRRMRRRSVACNAIKVESRESVTPDFECEKYI